MEQYLLSSNFSIAIISSYTSPELSQSNFENMLEPLQKLVRLSPPIAASLAVPEIFTRTVQKLGHKDAVTRLNLLRILSTLCDATEDECTLIRQFGVYDTIVHLSEHDHAVLVRQMASELVRACDSVTKRSTSRASGFRRPASSSGTRAGSGSSNGGGSTLVSGMTPPTPNSLKTAFAIPPVPPMPPTPTLMGSSRERVARSQSTAGIWNLQEEPERAKPPSLARASTALGVPNPSSSSSSSLASSRSRPPSRDTSSSSLALRLDIGGAAKDAVGSTSSTGGKSRLPKARQGRLSEAVSRRRQSQAGHTQGEENVTPGGGGAASGSGSGNGTPLPRLQIVRRRRETSGGEMSSVGRRGVVD